jgi:hypothetical protein
MLQLRKVIAAFAGAMVLVPIFAAMPLLLYRGYFWLKFGYALSFSGLDFLGAADMSGIIRAVQGIEWQGIKQVLLWVLSEPFELTLFALGIVSGVVANALYDGLGRPLEPQWKPEGSAKP